MVDKAAEESIGATTEMTAMIDRIADEIIETVIEMTVMIKVETGLEKGHFRETIATIIEIGLQGIVGPGQDPVQVLIETEFSVTSVGNMITLQRTLPLLGKKKR